MITWKQDNPGWGQKELHYAFDANGWKVGTVMQFTSQLTWLGIAKGIDNRAISLDAAKAWVEAQVAQPKEAEYA